MCYHKISKYLAPKSGSLGTLQSLSMATSGHRQGTTESCPPASASKISRAAHLDPERLAPPIQRGLTSDLV